MDLPEYKCLKGMWEKPVTADTERGARSAFRCDECSLFPRQCGGVGQLSKFATPDEKASVILSELARTPAKDARGGQAKRFVLAHLDELREAKAQGHSNRAIVRKLKEAGACVISDCSLSRYLKLFD